MEKAKRNLCCTDCGIRSCINCNVNHEKDMPGFCLTRQFEKESEQVEAKYQGEEAMRIMRGFLNIDPTGIHGGQASRVEMLIKLFHNLKVKKVGIACCYALLNEARVFAKILRVNGFEPVGVNCKVGTLNKQNMGIPADHDPYLGESSCNPILQAEILNDSRTDYNVILGLCVGHDAIFSKHSEAPVSTLAVKDFALAHNSIAVLHMADYYYKSLIRDPIV